MKKRFKKKIVPRSLNDRYVSLNQTKIPFDQIWYKTNNGKDNRCFG